METETSKQPTRTLAYLCPKCRQSVVITRTPFQLAASPNRLPCPCGGSALRVAMEADHADLTIPCISCGRDHHVRCSAHALLHEKALAFSCKSTGLDCCYIGDEAAVFSALRRLEEAAAELNEKTDDSRLFLNETIMTETLGELKDIASRDGISCICGSKEYTIKVHYSSVELICAACGSKLRLPAATGDDLEDLCCQYTLTIGGRRAVL